MRLLAKVGVIPSRARSGATNGGLIRYTFANAGIFRCLAALGRATNTDKALFEAMKAERIPIGERVIAEETALDVLFAERRITNKALNVATSRVSGAQGELRSANLRYHLAMAAKLSATQKARHAELRSYAQSTRHDHGNYDRQ